MDKKEEIKNIIFEKAYSKICNGELNESDLQLAIKIASRQLN